MRLVIKILPLFLVLALPNLSFASDSLIYSPSHGSSAVTAVTESSGTMEIAVSSFSKIKQIKSADQSEIAITGSNAQVLVPYEIVGEELTITIEVITEEGTEKKEFTLQLKKAETKGKKQFSLVTMMGTQYFDNATNAAEPLEKIAGGKLILTLVPKYKFELAGLELNLFSLVHREKFLWENLANQEVAFNQLGLGYTGKTDAMSWSLSAGVNDIGSELEGANAKNHLETDSFVKGHYHLSLGESSKIKLGFSYTRKKLKEADDEAYSGDGNNCTLDLAFAFPLWAVKTDLSIKGESNDAVGPYLDYETKKGNIKFQFPAVKKVRFSLVAAGSKKEFLLYDPLKGLKEADSTGSIAISAMIPIPKNKTTSLMSEIKHKEQGSNIDILNYQSNSMTLTLIHLF